MIFPWHILLMNTLEGEADDVFEACSKPQTNPIDEMESYLSWKSLCSWWPSWLLLATETIVLVDYDYWLFSSPTNGFKVFMNM